MFPFRDVYAVTSIANTNVSKSELDEVVETAMKESGTPGIAIATVNYNKYKLYSYGYADLEAKTEVTEDTLFELGSMSKAFTALGILYLEEEGLINLQDSIQEYIPWLTFRYKGEYGGQRVDEDVPVTIENVMHHTVGIPSNTLKDIPEGDSDDMLENVVRKLSGTYLDFYPGTKYSYATIDYDILGLIIQTVLGETYEDFMREKILEPLGLYHTYAMGNQIEDSNLISKGYKKEFLQVKEYNAPVYRGNTPAGYIISSAEDMLRWMQIQMGLIKLPDSYEKLIEKSHIGDNTVSPVNDYYYAAGWNVHIRGEVIAHSGANPNYSSVMIMNNQGVGICILSNLNSNAANYIATNFFNLIYGRDIGSYEDDLYKKMYNIFTALFIFFSVFAVVYVILLLIAIVQILKKKRKREIIKGVKVAGIFLTICIMIFYVFCIYYLPNILFERLSWKSISVWGSKSIICGSLAALVAGIVFFLYILVTCNYPRPKEKNYFLIVPLSVINGLSSALIIFVINESFNRNLEYSKELLLYFIFSIVLFVYTMKLLQGRMIVITNEIMHDKRVMMIDKIIHTSYQNIERIGSERIYSGLNNDINEIAQLPNWIVKIASNTLTFIFCLAFILANSVGVFLASIGVIVINCVAGFLTSRRATTYWEKNRNIQDIYFRQLKDLLYGFKELVLGGKRRAAFYEDIKKYTRLSTELSKEASIHFLNYGLYNTLLYNIIFGVVVFIFPICLGGISVNELRETLFMVFYMIGPFKGIIDAFPKISEITVSVRRMKVLNYDLDTIDTINTIDQNKLELKTKKIERIEFKKVQYTYHNGKENETETFKLGPVDFEVNQGEIVFITGGNGSGKSTLGKLIVGLYQPDCGEVFINGALSTPVQLNSCFSAVFSDYYLFGRLYGIDIEKEKDELNYLLRLMKIEEKVQIESDGSVNANDLSVGQKKRLAYVICYLDKKPFLLFDEWAAEQDPQFRKYFYTELLPILKSEGKGVVVITHDDRYFHLADKIIKLERGEIIKDEDISFVECTDKNLVYSKEV